MTHEQIKAEHAKYQEENPGSDSMKILMVGGLTSTIATKSFILIDEKQNTWQGKESPHQTVTIQGVNIDGFEKPE